MDIQEYDFRTIMHYGWVWASLVDDPSASNGHALRIPKNPFEWAARMSITADDLLFENANADTRFNVVVYARCDATVNKGLALNCSVFDDSGGKMVMQKNCDASEIAGLQYKKIEFGPIPFTKSMSIRFAPPSREGEVQAVYIDRVLLLKDY